MIDAILLLNPGSSRLKFSIFGLSDQDLGVVAHESIEGLEAKAQFRARDEQGRTLADLSLGDPTRSFGYADAFTHLARWAYEGFAGECEPFAEGHRVVHGGLWFNEPTLIDVAVMAKLRQRIPLMPPHQPHKPGAIKAVIRLSPELPQVACFDTAFHRGSARGDGTVRPAR
ncbi:MAG: hypothetical protein KJ000_26850 [Pirellulaceae bacterium]|nr:hypothetical protein [Pirellulaceae bacterium]